MWRPNLILFKEKMWHDKELEEKNITHGQWCALIIHTNTILLFFMLH